MEMATSTIKMNGLGSPIAVNLGYNWTAPSDGLINLYVAYNSGNKFGYMYVTDYTTNTIVGAISEPGANGNSASTMFPVVKGHIYKISHQAEIGESRATFYAI